MRSLRTHCSGPTPCLPTSSLDVTRQTLNCPHPPIRPTRNDVCVLSGFCHWPQPAWRRPDGSWVPSTAQLTSLATPSAVGSGKSALVTLMHEGGHAAHFANIDQPSPFFSQERAPTSVAYCEVGCMPCRKPPSKMDSIWGPCATVPGPYAVGLLDSISRHLYVENYCPWPRGGSVIREVDNVV